MRGRQRGFVLLEAMLSVAIAATALTTLIYAWRIADHYATVWGTAVGFARLAEAERSYRRAGFVGDLDFTKMQILMPGIKVHSTTAAHANPVGHPYELRMVGGEQVYTTLMNTEAEASQVAAKLSGRGRYEPDGDGFRVFYQPIRTATLTELIRSRSMHVSGPYGRALKDRLNFGPGAIVAVNSVCHPPGEPNADIGGLSIDKDGRLVSCVRISANPLIKERRWRIVGSSSPTTALTCDDGTTVSSLSRCVPCSGGTIGPGKTCPVVETCGDGTAVSDRTAECKTCAGGSNVHKSKTCPSAISCGDGTKVQSRVRECKTCGDGLNIHVGKTCTVPPKKQICNDGTLVVDRKTECKFCPDNSHIHIAKTCPPLSKVQRCDDGTVVQDKTRECKTCQGQTKTIYHRDTCSTVPVKNESCGDGTKVESKSKDCKDCWNGDNIEKNAACPVQPACGDGTPVTDKTKDCKDCSDGRNIHKDSYCDACDDGTKVNDVSKDCKTCLNKTIHQSKTCPTCADDNAIVDDPNADCQTCDGKSIVKTASCFDCDIGGESVSSCGTCVSKTIKPGMTCPSCGDGTKVDDKSSDCKTCALAGTNIPIGDDCPSCGDGTEVADKAKDCKTCGDGRNIPVGSICDACGDGTPVNDVSAECKTCWNRTIHKSKTCTTCDDNRVVDNPGQCKTCLNETVRNDQTCL